MALLQIEPEIRTVAAQFPEPQCHDWCHRLLFIENIIERLTRHAEQLCDFRLADQVPAKSHRAEALRDAWGVSRTLEVSWSSNLSLMIMFQIDVDGIAFCPPKRDPPVSADIDCIATFAQVLIEPVTEILARLARDAYRDFGKASGLPAGLNFGDCFSYALAKVTGEALLLKGADFGPM